MSIARHHAEWLSLVEVSGPFLSMPVLMRVFPQGLEAHDTERFRLLKVAYEEWDDNNQAGRRHNPAIHINWIRFVLRNMLGLPDDCIAEGQAIPQTLQTAVAQHGETLRPSLVIRNAFGGPDAEKPRLLIQVYPFTQSLTKPVAGETWKASPDTRMMELLHAIEVPLGLVTNGEHWMLVHAPRSETTGYASWYAHLWLEEQITLRAFTSLLNANRFFGVPEQDTLRGMLEESATNQQEVTDQLGYQVRNAVEVLVQSLDRADQDHGRQLLADLSEAELYEAALTVMMRLVFLFCAEERGLILLGDSLYDENYAVSTLQEQLRETADQHGEEILERRHDAWNRLLSTFRAVFGGVDHERMTLPAYGGKLFDPDRFAFLEGRKRGTTWKINPANPLPVNNRTVLHLLDALQLLQVKVPGGGPAEARRLSFRALGIEQIGHVYEGLLDHTAKRATEPVLGLAGSKDKEPEIALSQLEQFAAKGEAALVEFLKDETGRSANAIKNALHEEIDLTNFRRFEAMCGTSSDGKKLLERVKPFVGLIRDDTFGYPVIIPKGSVYVTAGTDRRSSGTHYTPPSLTEPIVRYTLEPLVYAGPAERKPEKDWKLRPAKELLDLKICDMACGSGAFLVQACRYMAERMLEAWDIAEKFLPKNVPGITPDGSASSGKAGETLIPKDISERQVYAQRLIAQRCLYGVDINPLAAEMAKLSLWLLTLAKDKPFTFLDHAIRCGDSLLGIHDLKQLKNFSLDGTGQQYVFGEISLDKMVDDAIELRLKLESMPGNSVEDIDTQARLMIECEKRVEFLKRAADMLTAAELKAASPRDKIANRDHAAIRIGHYLQSGRQEDFTKSATDMLGGRRTFHWPLEFPEVMVQRNGFDAFVGNPPFVTGKRISSLLGPTYEEYLKAIFHDSKGAADICCFFLRRAFTGTNPRTGQVGMIATKSIAEGDSRLVGLLPILESSGTIRWVRHEIKWPGSAGVTVSLVVISRCPWDGSSFLNDAVVSDISSRLTQEESSAFPLVENKGHCSDGIKIQGDGFIVSSEERNDLISKDKSSEEVISPYMTGMDMVQGIGCKPSAWIINFRTWNEQRASAYRGPFKLLVQRVKPYRDSLKGQIHERDFWKFWDKREQFFDRMSDAPRILACPSTAKFLIMTFIEKDWIASHSVKLFAYSDYWSFSVMQSNVHELWAREQSGKLEQRLAYNLSNAFATFPWPTKEPDRLTGKAYYDFRASAAERRQLCFTDIYNLFHDRENTTVDISELRELHIAMDRSVAAAYGWSDLHLDHDFHDTRQGIRFTISEGARREVLTRLLKLNHDRHAKELTTGPREKRKSNGHPSDGRSSRKSDANVASLFRDDG